jgi:hypothetical protein
MSVVLTKPYLFTRLAGCSVKPGISRSACKLAQTPRVIKKKKKIDIYVVKNKEKNKILKLLVLQQSRTSKKCKFQVNQQNQCLS